MSLSLIVTSVWFSSNTWSWWRRATCQELPRKLLVHRDKKSLLTSAKGEKLWECLVLGLADRLQILGWPRSRSARST